MGYEAFVWWVLAALAGNALLFVHSAATPFVRADVWRHLKFIVIPFLEGGAGWQILWANHHPFPLLHLLQIANIKLAGLRLDLDAYAGLLFQILLSVLLTASVLRSIRARRGEIDLLAALGCIGMLLILLGLNNPVQFTWPLVSLIQWMLFFGLVLLLSADAASAGRGRHGLWPLTLSAIVLLLLHEHFALIFLVTAIASCLLIYPVARQRDLLRTAAVMAACLVAYKLLLGQLVPSSGAYPAGGSLDRLLELAAHLPEVVLAYCLGLASGITHLAALRARFPGFEYVIVAGAVCLGMLFVLATALLLARRPIRPGILPLALMIFSLTFSAGFFVFRFDPAAGDPWSFAWPRYAPSQKLALGGLIWASLLLLPARHESAALAARLARALAGLVLAALIALQCQLMLAAWRDVPTHALRNANLSLALYLQGTPSENDIELPFIITGNNRNLADTIGYLKAEGLNVFSPRYPGYPVLQDHQAQREGFMRSTAERESWAVAELPVTPEQVFDGQWVRWRGPNGAYHIEVTSDRDLFARLRVQATKTRFSGLRLRPDEGSAAPVDRPVFPGHQAHYVKLDSGQAYRLTLADSARLIELEVVPSPRD